MDTLTCYAFCGESFKECDTVIPGVGVILGETDVVEWRGRYWYEGCVADYNKTKGHNK